MEGEKTHESVSLTRLNSRKLGSHLSGDFGRSWTSTEGDGFENEIFGLDSGGNEIGDDERYSSSTSPYANIRNIPGRGAERDSRCQFLVSKKSNSSRNLPLVHKNDLPTERSNRTERRLISSDVEERNSEKSTLLRKLQRRISSIYRR